jgi:Na+-driven multidrug efflux pump
MMTIMLGAVINIILDPIFIFVLGLGVRGVALATVIAQFFSALWVMRFLTGKKAILRLKLSCMKIQIERVRRILILGISGCCMNITTSLTQIVSNVMLQRFGGDLYIGVMAILGSIREVIFMPVNGIHNGLMPVIGYNYGAGKNDRVRQAIKFSTTATVSYSLVVWSIIMLIPGTLISIFSSEPALVKVGVPAMRIYYALFVFMSLHMSTQGVFLGLGKAKYAIFFSLLRKALIAAPLTIMLPLMFGLGTNGVFIAEAISHLISGLACITTMYIVVYRKLFQSTLPE